MTNKFVAEIQMQYMGSVLSVNHYLGKMRQGGFYVKREVVDWKEELGWKLKPHHIEDWELPLTVTCSGVFRDKRSTPDLSNLSKVILDALEEVTGINDKNMRWRDGTIEHQRYASPYLIITIESE